MNAKKENFVSITSKFFFNPGDRMFRLWFIQCFLFCFLIFNDLYSQPDAEELLLETINISKKVISQSPNLIKWSTSDRIYLDDERIFTANREGYGYDLLLDDGQRLYSPLVLCDEKGPFLFTSAIKFSSDDKPFKNVCNNCDFEWCGGWLVLRCPNCGSKDIRSNVPNR